MNGTPVRLVPIYDADGQRVGQINPATHELHDPHTGRLLRPGTKKLQRAVEAVRDSLESE